MKMPKVSFLLLCYNQERFVKDAVQGALDQDYANIEIIISDDASSDSTMEIINEVVSLNKKMMVKSSMMIFPGGNSLLN